MSELFKPEIKDVGGTNVSAYSPPTMDYSGIFNSLARTLNSFEKEKVAAPKLSEAEEKNLVLEPYLTKAQKILSSDEIPEVKKYALVNGIKLEVNRKYSAYRETFETSLGSITKTIDPDGDPIQKYYEDLAKWGESETGMFARTEAFNLSIDEEGKFDDGLYQAKYRELYLKDIQNAETLAVLKRQNEMDSQGASLRFRKEFAPTLVRDISKDIETFTSGIANKALLQSVKEGAALGLASQEAAEALLLADQVALLKKRWKEEGTKRLVQAGFPINEAEYNIDPLLIELSNLEDGLRNGGESVNKVMKSMNEQISTLFVSNMPPVMRLANEAKLATPPEMAANYASQLMLQEGNRQQLADFAKSNFNLPSYTVNLSSIGSGQTSTATELPVGADKSISSIQTMLPEFDGSDIEKILAMKPNAKKEMLKRTDINIESGVPKDQALALTAAKDLTGSYIAIATRLAGATETGVTPLDQTKIFFGPKALNLITEIGKKSPDLAESLYGQVNKAIQTETLRQYAYLESGLGKVFPNNPIIFEVNDKNMVEFKFDPVAKREDPNLKRLVSLGNDTDEKLFKAYQEYYNLNPRLMKDLNDSVEALNIYLMASNRLPDSLKNSPNFAGIFIRTQLAKLPKYGGSTVDLNVIPQ